MSESSTNDKKARTKARRKLLKTLVTGGGVVTAAKVTPDEWIKPAVEAVVLPGHAQTSQEGGDGPSPIGNFNALGQLVGSFLPQSEELLADSAISDELLEFFMPSARAQICPVNTTCSVDFFASVSDSDISVCLNGLSSGFFQESVNLLANPPQFTGPQDLGGLIVFDGQFVGGNWVLSVQNTVSNVSSDITLTPGSLGCPPL